MFYITVFFFWKIGVSVEMLFQLFCLRISCDFSQINISISTGVCKVICSTAVVAVLYGCCWDVHVRTVICLDTVCFCECNASNGKKKFLPMAFAEDVQPGETPVQQVAFFIDPGEAQRSP